MGLLKKHKGKPCSFTFFLHIHNLTWSSDAGALCVRYERGSSHSGITRAAAPTGPRSLLYVFEEQMQLPATLYQDATAAKKGTAKGLGPFEPKPLLLAVVPADSRGKPASGPVPLATATINLADFAAADGQAQQELTLHTGVDGRNSAASGVPPKLLLTIGCRDSTHRRGGGPLAVEPSASSLEPEGLPTSLSTDDEGSRPSSRTNSRPASRVDTAAGLRSNSALSSVREEPVHTNGYRNRSQAPAGATGNAAAPLAADIASPPEQPAAAEQIMPTRQGSRYDEDGFLVDDEEGAPTGEPSLEQSGSVRRNLGSALERAEASEAASAVEQGASSGVPAVEVQSRLATGAAGAGKGLAGLALARQASGRSAALVPPRTPSDALSAEPESPVRLSTGQQSSLSAAGDPAVPFTVPPSTHRRFAQRGDEAGGAAGAGRRWAWRREGGGLSAAGSRAGGAAGAVGGVSVFQRARVASVTKHDAGVAAGVAGEAVGQSAGSAAPSSNGDLPSRRTTSEDHAPDAVLDQPPLQLQSSAGTDTAASLAGLTLRSSSAEGAAAAAGAPRGQPLLLQRSLLMPGGGMRAQLSVIDSLALPSPNEAGGAANSLLLEALLQELRILAALESAVYLAAGRKTFVGGSNRHLHAPARRLARTIISLGPQEGPTFGMQAIAAIQTQAGASSGDMHSLTFWWSNVLQLRVQLSALCADGGLGQQQALGAGEGRGGGFSQELQPQGSEQHLSPRSALAVAAAARATAASGLDWMQALVPQLRDLEALLFSEMVKHLWWHVLLQGVTAAARSFNSNGGSGAAAGASGSASAFGSGSGGNGWVMRSARSAPHLVAAGSAGSEVASPASLQGTPRSFETAEEEALHRWVEGLGAVERSMRDPSRPAAAPRAHLALLHRQLIIAVLRRLDTLLFRKLLLEEGESLPLRFPSMSERDAFSRGAEADELLGPGADAAAVGLLEPSLLPFARGAVTFSTGVNLKMAVSRLNSWAADFGVKEDRLPQAGRSTEMSDYRLFPCLRATADLLMMPKQVLADPQMRREVVPGLPLHRICQLLQRFEPDECAPDPLPPGLLEALQSESPRSDGGSTPSPTAKAEGEYLPPVEAALLADGVVEPQSLEMDEESEDELEGLARQYSPQTAGGTDLLSPVGSGGMLAPGEELRAHRFALLRDLWASAGQ